MRVIRVGLMMVVATALGVGVATAQAKPQTVAAESGGVPVSDFALTILAAGGVKWDSPPHSGNLTLPSSGGIFDGLNQTSPRFEVWVDNCEQPPHIYWVAPGAQLPADKKNCSKSAGFIEWGQRERVTIDVSGPRIVTSPFAPTQSGSHQSESQRWLEVGFNAGLSRFGHAITTGCTNILQSAMAAGFMATCNIDGTGLAWSGEAWYRMSYFEIGGGFLHTNKVTSMTQATNQSITLNINGFFGPVKVPFLGVQGDIPAGPIDIEPMVGVGFWRVPSGSTTQEMIGSSLIGTMSNTQNDSGTGVLYGIAVGVPINDKVAIKGGFKRITYNKASAKITGEDDSIGFIGVFFRELFGPHKNEPSGPYMNVK